MARGRSYDAPDINQDIHMHVTGSEELAAAEEEIDNLTSQIEDQTAEIDRLNSKLDEARDKIWDLEREIGGFKSGRAIADLNDEIEELKWTLNELTSTGTREFTAFLQSVNLLAAGDSVRHSEFSSIFEKVEEGALTANEAIARVKSGWGYLIDTANGAGLDTQILSSFTGELDRLADAVSAVVMRIDEMQKNGVKAIGDVAGAGGSNISSTASVFEQIQTALSGMTDDARASAAPLIDLFGAATQFASIDDAKLTAVSQAFKNIGNIGASRFGDKTVNNIISMTKQLQDLAAKGQNSIRFDFTGFNELKVSKASMNNLATYLPQIAAVSPAKLERLSKVDLTNFNNIKVSKASLEAISQLADAMRVLREVRATLGEDTGSAAPIVTRKDIADYEKKGAQVEKLQNLQQSAAEMAAKYSANDSISDGYNKLAQSIQNVIDTHGDETLDSLTKKTKEYSESLKEMNASTKAYEKGESVKAGQVEKLLEMRQQALDSASLYTTEGNISGDYEKIASSIQDVVDNQNKLTPEEITQKTKELSGELKRLNATAKETGAAEHIIQDGSKRGLTVLSEMQKRYSTITDALTKYRSMQTGRSERGRSAYATLAQEAVAVDKLKQSYEAGTLTEAEYSQEKERIRQSSTSAIRVLEEESESANKLGNAFKTVLAQFGRWIGVHQILIRAFNSLRQMVTTTIELDDAMTQLKVVTNDTNAAYERFGTNIASIATEIGSSISDLIDSTTTYARLGYNLDEASQLAKYTGMLQNVGDIDVESAQNAITAMIKAYGKGADDLETIMDEMVVVGNGFPISVAQIAEGMNNASSTLAASGNTLEQSIALLTAANVTTQNAAKSSTALRTITARLRNTTADLEELGEEMTTAKYEELVSALTDLQVRLTDVNGEYRSTYDILSDLAAKWDDLTSMEQAALATQIAGVRQQSVFYSILNEFDEASGAMDAMANSSGALSGAYSTYMESITAHINQFKAAFQSLSDAVVDNGMAKAIIDIGTGILNVATALAKAKVLIPAVFGAAGFGMIAKVLVKSNAFKATVDDVTRKLVTEKGAVDTLRVSIAALSAEEKKAVISKIMAKVATGDLTEEEARQILVNAGLIESDEVLAAANEKLAATNALVGSSMGWIGIASIAIGALAAILPALSGAFDKSTASLKDLQGEMSNLVSESSRITSEFKNTKDSADEIIPRFVELAKGVDSLGKKTADMTDEDYAEFLDLSNQLAEIFPELNVGMDENGNTMLALDYNASNLNDTLQELIDSYHRLALEQQAATLDDMFGNIKDQQDAAEEDKKSLQGVQTAYERLLDQVNNTPYGSLDLEKYFGGPVEALRNYLGDFKWDELTKHFQTEDGIDWKAFLNSDILKAQIDAIDDNMDVLDASVRSQLDKVRSAMSATMQLTPAYENMDEDSRSMADLLLANFDMSSVDLSQSAEQMKDQVIGLIDTGILDPISQAAPEAKKAFGDLFDLRSAFANGETSALDYSEQLKQIFSDLSSYGISDDLVAQIKLAINYEDFDKELSFVLDNIEGKAEEVNTFVKSLDGEQIHLIYGILNESGSMTIDDLIDKFNQLYYTTFEPLDFSSMFDGLNGVKEKVEGITSAMQSLADGTALTTGQLAELAMKYPELLTASNLFTDGSVEGQQAMLNAFLEGYENEYDAHIDTKIAELQATHQAIQDQINIETEKENILKELEAMTQDEKLFYSQEYVDKVNDLNALQGKNFVTFEGDTLKVNKETLDKRGTQEDKFANEATEKIWDPFADAVFQSMTEPYAHGSDGMSGYSSDLSTNLNRVTSNTLMPYSENMAAALQGKLKGNVKSSSPIAAIASMMVNVGNSAAAASGLDIQYHGGGGLNVTQEEVGDWIDRAEDATREKIEKLNDFDAKILTAIDNLTALKGLNLKDLYGTKSSSGSGRGSGGNGGSGGSGSKSNDKTSDEDNAFKKAYKEHKHLVEMDQELTSTFLTWLAKASKQAYKDGLITLDEYRSYQQEVYKGIQTLKKNAEQAMDSLIDYRIKMLKQNMSDEKDSLEKRLKALKEFYDEQKAMLQDKYDEEKYLDEQAQKRKSVSDLESELEQLKYDDSAKGQKRRLEIEQELADAKKDLSEFEKENALDKALKSLDDSYNAQEKIINEQIEQLSEAMDDPNRLYNKALADIKGNTKQLYNAMILFNRAFGDGNDETIKAMWETAYATNEEYKKVNGGKGVKDINLVNATNYKWKPAKDTTPKTNSSSKKNDKGSSSSSTKKSEKKNDSKPSLSNGSVVTVKKTATNFSSRSGNLRMASWVPGSKFTVYQVSGDEVLLGLNGVYTGWVKKKDIQGYAKGTKKAAKGLFQIDEAGTETIFQSSDGGKYKLFTGGEKVLNAKASNFLYDFATTGGEILGKVMKSAFGATFSGGIGATNIANEINMGDIIIQGNADKDTVSSIRRAQRASLENMLKELNKLNR